jgi:hypothetical protein
MLPFATLILALGLALYLLARRGFTSGTHPVCAACAYDLHMLPLDTQRCPECGADILAENAIRIGRRRPSLTGQLAGTLLSIAGAILLVLAISAWWKTFDGTRHMPLSMLEHRINSSNGDLRTRACAELRRRIHARSISAEQMNHVAQRILKWQHDPATHWDPRWGDMIECGHLERGAHRRSLLSQTLWQDYLRQAMQVQFAARPRVREGQPIPLRISCTLKAGTDPVAIGVTFSPRATLLIGDSKEQVNGSPRSAAVERFDWVFVSQSPSDPRANVIAATVTLTAHDGTADIDRTWEFKAPIEFVKDSPVSLRAANAATLREFESAIQWRLKEFNGVIRPTFGKIGDLWISGPPVAACFRVVLRQQGREWPLARLLVQPDNAQAVPLTLPASVPGDGLPQSGEAEIICIPDRATAESTVDVLEIWGTEIRRRIVLSEVSD